MAKILFVTGSSELGFFDTVTLDAQFAAFTNRPYTDVAIAPDGQIYASSFDSLYRITLIGGNVGETYLGAFGNGSVNALDFTDDGVLVAAGASELFTYDIATGTKTTITFMPSSSSGDVEVLGTEAYVALTDGTLQGFDLTTGANLGVSIPTPSSTWGLSYADGALYGFAGRDVAVFDLQNNSYTHVDQDTDAISGVYYGSSSNGVIRFDATTDGDNRIVGGDFDERFDGGLANDTIEGGGGDDTVLGGAGDDQIWAGSGDTGNDSVAGGDGNDVMGGGAGNDTMLGEDGADIVYGGPGADYAEGGNGGDLIWMGSEGDIGLGGDGNDILGGGIGNDTLSGGAGDDVIYGALGFDVLAGEDGSDLIFGGDDDDTINGGAGNDTLYGGNGNDLFVMDAPFGSDSIGGYDRLGNDALDFRGSGLTGLDQLTIVQVSGDTEIRTDFGTLTLWNVDVATLDTSDFLF